MFKGLVWTPGTTTSLSDYRRFGRMPNHVRFVIPSRGSPNACGTANRVTKYESAHLCHLPTRDRHQGYARAFNFPFRFHTRRARTIRGYRELYQVNHQHGSKVPRWRDEDKQLVIDVLTEHAYGR